MMSFVRSSRRAAVLALAAFALSAAACSNKDDHGEPEVESMRVTVAGQAPITISATTTRNADDITIVQPPGCPYPPALPACG